MLDVNDPAVDVNPFLAGWIGELALAAIANAPDRSSVSEWKDVEWKDNIIAAFETSFSGLHVEDEPPLKARIGEEVDKPEVAKVLSLRGRDVQIPDEQWLNWLQQRYLPTIRAVQAAVQTLLPDFDVEDSKLTSVIPILLVDLWLTETVVGGGGVIEAFERHTLRILAGSGDWCRWRLGRRTRTRRRYLAPGSRSC